MGESQEKFHLNWGEKITKDEKRDVKKLIDRLKNEGFEFDFQETSDEFIISLKNKITHITKVADPIASFAKVIEASIRYPEEKLDIALEKLDKNKSPL